MKKLEIIFKRKGKEVTIEEMEKGLIEDINATLDDMSTKKVSFLKSILFKVNTIAWITLIALIVIGPYVLTMIHRSDEKAIFLVATIFWGLLVISNIIWLLTDIADVYKDTTRIRAYIKKAQEEKNIERKFARLCDAEEIACEFEEFSDMRDFKFDVVDDFLTLREVVKQEILEYSLATKTYMMVLKTADKNGTVQTALIALDEKRESTKVTNDVLICSDEGTTYIKAFKK